jgi:hypothetical protein
MYEMTIDGGLTWTLRLKSGALVLRHRSEDRHAAD